MKTLNQKTYNPVPGFVMFTVAAWVVVGAVVLAVYRGGPALLKWAGVW